MLPRVRPEFVQGFLFCLAVMLCFVGLVMVRDSRLLLDANIRLFHTTINYVSLAVCLLLSGLLLFLSRPWTKSRGRRFGFPSAMAIRSSVLFALLMTAIPVLGNDIDQLLRWPWLWVRYLNVAAIEEFVFRAIIFEALRRSIGVGWSIVTSSILFALAHYLFILLGAQIDVSLVDFVVKSSIGAVLCVYYLDFGLLAVVLLHAAIDVLGNSVGAAKQFVVLGFLVLWGTLSILRLRKKQMPKTPPPSSNPS